MELPDVRNFREIRTDSGDVGQTIGIFEKGFT